MNKKINWKVRFKNKVFLSAFLSLIISFVYGMLKIFDVYPSFTENQVVAAVDRALTIFGMIGIIVDPTTEGLYDSERALTYSDPWTDEPKNSDDADDPDDQE